MGMKSRISTIFLKFPMLMGLLTVLGHSQRNRATMRPSTHCLPESGGTRPMQPTQGPMQPMQAWDLRGSVVLVFALLTTQVIFCDSTTRIRCCKDYHGWFVQCGSTASSRQCGWNGGGSGYPSFSHLMLMSDELKFCHRS